jgi:predicted O-methyltransferase YrrM
MIDIPTGITQTEVFRLREMAKDKTVLEIGSLLGFSTVNLAQVAKLVHSVDPHEGYPDNDPKPTLQPFQDNLERYGVTHRVVIHVGKAQDILPTLEPIFDFAFIDVNGKYEDTAYCIWAAGRLIKPNGWMAIHDFGRTNPDCGGATRAIMQYMKDRGPDSPTFTCETTIYFQMKGA